MYFLHKLVSYLMYSLQFLIHFFPEIFVLDPGFAFFFIKLIVFLRIAHLIYKLNQNIYQIVSFFSIFLLYVLGVSQVCSSRY